VSLREQDYHTKPREPLCYGSNGEINLSVYQHCDAVCYIFTVYIPYTCTRYIFRFASGRFFAYSVVGEETPIKPRRDLIVNVGEQRNNRESCF